MIWALLFGLLFSVIGGGSPSMLHGSEKLVKRHVEDKSRQERLLFLIHESQKEQKNLKKDYKSFSKEMKSLLQSKNTERAYFNLSVNRLKCLSEKSNVVNMNLAMESQELITHDEWLDIKVEFREGLHKMTKVFEKDKMFVKKHFNKLQETIHKHVQEKDRADQCILGIKQAEASILSYLYFYQNEIENEESIIYQYRVDKKEVENMQSKYAFNVENLLDDYVSMYFTIVENTNDKEWKKIRNKIKLPI